MSVSQPSSARKRRLIEDDRMGPAASTAGAAERYRRGETPHTVHVWWARRPHVAMRLLTYACLSREPFDEAEPLLARLSEPSPSRAALDAARDRLRSERGEPPRVLDMFGGGGTIPFEAANLGAESHALDNNELAVFTQKCLLEYSAGLDPATVLPLLQDSGERVLARLRDETAPLFPARGRAFGYYWTWILPCPACGEDIPLSRRPWLSRRGGRRIAVHADGRVGAVEEGFAPASAWLGRTGRAACPACGHVVTRPQLRDCRETCVALAGPDRERGRGKAFAAADADARPAADLIAATAAAALDDLRVDPPSTEPPLWSGIVNPALYGMTTHADLFNPRQRAVMLLLVRALRDEHRRLLAVGCAATAKFVTGMLSGLLDQLVDWNGRLSMWIPQNEQVGRAFCGPGVAMIWDYMETDPAAGGPANLRGKLGRITAGAAAVLKLPAPATVRHGRAQSLPWPDGRFDAVITDPPYYDNLFYGALADFFFAWKRLLLRDLEPELFAAPRTRAADELVASRRRAGTAERAHDDYRHELGLALAEAERVLKPDGVMALVYGHGSLRGWRALIEAWRATGLRVIGVRPLDIERKQRPRAMRARAVNACVAFIAAKGGPARAAGELAAIRAEFARIMDELPPRLRSAGWADAEIGVAVFARAVALLCNVSAVSSDGRDLPLAEALTLLADDLSRRLPGFRVATRGTI